MTKLHSDTLALSASPRIGPRAPEHLIVLLAAAGEMADDLIPVADTLVTRIPNAAAVILTPPPGGGGAWFLEVGGVSDVAAVEAGLTDLWPRILKAGEGEGVSSERISVFGFGQGATLAMAAAAAGFPFACVLALAGRLVGESKARRAGSPDLFVSCGEADSSRALSDSQGAAEAFMRRGYDVALITVPHLSHEIGAEQLHHGASFVRGVIAERRLDHGL